MNRLLNLYARKPYLLDLSIALVMLPAFCHFMVTLHSKRTFCELFFMKAYWIPMVLSYVCGLAVMAYIRLNNYLFDRRYGTDGDWNQRAAYQLKWNILPPLVFVILVVAIYFDYYNVSIFQRGYLRKDIFLVCMGITLLVLLYYVHNKHQYFWKKQEEKNSYEQLVAESMARMASDVLPECEPPDAKTTIWVLNPENREEAIKIPLDAIAVIERHYGKTRVSTWDGQLLEWPMPGTQMRLFTKANGFTWFGQHYGLLHASVEKSEGIGQQGRRLLLREGIVVAKEKQVLNALLDGQWRTYLVFHKNIAKEVGNWFNNRDEQGRPESERP